MKTDEGIEVFAMDFHISTEQIERIKESESLPSDCEDSVAQLKTEEVQLSISDYLHIIIKDEVREYEPSTMVHQHTIRWIKTEEEHESSSVMDLLESSDLEKIKDEEDPSLGDACGSVDCVNVEIQQNPFANDCNDTKKLKNEEAWEKPYTVPLPEEGEETSGTEPQDPTTFSTHEVKEEPCAYDPNQEGEMTESRAAGSILGRMFISFRIKMN